VGFVCIALVVLAISAVSVAAKMAARRGVPALDLSVVLFVVSTGFSAAWVAARHHGFPGALFTPEVMVVAGAAGAGGALAVFCFNHAVRMGHFGFSNAIYRSSFLVPVVAGVLWFGAALKPTTVVGIVLILAGIFLMSWSADSFRPGRAQELRWFLVIVSAFLLSGLPRLGQLVTSAQAQDYFIYLLLSYAAGAVVLLVPAVAVRRLHPQALLYGAVAGLASYAGVFFTLEALERLKAPVVFPITLSGPIVMGLLVSLAVFRERIRLCGWLGIGSAVVGIVVLGIWK